MKYKDFLKNITGCPFCEGNNKVIVESEESFMTYALWPYHKHHLLIIPKRHIESLSEMNDAEREDVDLMQEKALNALRKLGYERIIKRVGDSKQPKRGFYVKYLDKE